MACMKFCNRCTVFLRTLTVSTISQILGIYSIKFLSAVPLSKI